MGNAPLISVIVPVYNKEKYIRECLDSLVNQTYPNKEIILSDDGSTDSSGRICDEYAQKYDFVRVVHKENGGPSSAWKAGFKISEGEYLMFVDSDDYVALEILEKMSECLTFIPKEIILCDHAITRDDGSEKKYYQALLPGEYNEEEIKDKIYPNILGREDRIITFSRCLKLIERSLIADNVDYCDDRVLMGDDSTIILPALLDARRIFMMDHKVYYFYRYIDDSIVHRYNADAFSNNKLHYEALKRVLEDKYVNDEAMKEFMIASLNKEELFLLLILVKNEVRGNPKGCTKNLKAMHDDDFFRGIVDNTSVTIQGMANRLIYMVLKNPSRLNVGLLKLATALYDR